MKKLLLAILVSMLIQAPLFAAADASSSGRVDESYVDTGTERSIEATLDSTPGTLTTIDVPDDSKGFKLYPRTNHIRFAVYYANSVRTLAAVATDTDNTIADTDLAIGGIAKPDIWETRLLPPKTPETTRILTLRSTTADVVVDVEFF